MNNLDKKIFEGIRAMEGQEETWDKEEALNFKNFLTSGDMNMFDACPTKIFYNKIQKEGFLCDMGFHFAVNAKRAMSSAMKIKKEGSFPTWDTVLNKEVREGKTLKALWEDTSSSGSWIEEPEYGALEENLEQIKELTELFAKDVLDTLNPMLIDAKVFLPLPGAEEYNLFLTDFIDVVDKEGVVHLLKFVGKSPWKDKDNGGFVISGNYMQSLTAYSALLNNFKLPEEGQPAKVIYFVKTKVPKIITQEVTITQKQVDTLKRKAYVQWKIVADKLYTTRRGSEFCKPGKGGCSYYESCHVDF